MDTRKLMERIPQQPSGGITPGIPAMLAALAIGLAAMALPGCGGGNENADGNANASGTQRISSSDALSGAADRGGSPAASRAGAPSQATIDGTLTLFIEALEEGDFARASDYTDPGSGLHDSLLKMAENVEVASQKEDPERGNIGDLVRLTFAVRFAGAMHEITAEDGDRATATLTLPGAEGEQRPVELQSVDGRWFIIAGSELLSAPQRRPAGNTPRPVPAPAPPR